MTKIIRYNKCANNCEWYFKDIKKGTNLNRPFLLFSSLQLEISKSFKFDFTWMVFVKV